MMLKQGMVLETASANQLQTVRELGEDVSYETPDQVVEASEYMGKIYIHNVQAKHNLEAVES